MPAAGQPGKATRPPLHGHVDALFAQECWDSSFSAE